MNIFVLFQFLPVTDSLRPHHSCRSNNVASISVRNRLDIRPKTVRSIVSMDMLH